MNIAIVDYGCGNLTSVHNAFKYLGYACRIESNSDRLMDYSHLVIPGVGAFGWAMQQLRDSGMAEAIVGFSGTGKPMLGICLGMQLLLSSSVEHGRHDGLNIIRGDVLSLASCAQGVRIPNIGWCKVNRKEGSVLLRGIESKELCFYFVHSYFCKLHDAKNVYGTLNYGTLCDVIVESGNVFGCQFHPEKSQSSGLAILKNFVEAPCS